MLQVFRIKNITFGFERRRNDQTVIPMKSKTVPDIQSLLH
jgi:hypothetical protein